MLNIILSLVIAASPVKKAVTIDGPYTHPAVVKMDTTDMNKVGETVPDGNGWRVFILSGAAHNNIEVVSKDTLFVLWAPYSGDADNFFLGAKASYSFDGGATWTEYDIDATTLHNRLYPDVWFDKTTNTPWFAYQERVVGNPAKIYVAYDMLFPNGIFSPVELPESDDYWEPSIVAVGDNVVVVADNIFTGTWKVWKSTDHGATFTVVDSVTYDSVNHDTPGLYYDESTNRLFIAGCTYNADDSVYVMWSDDFGDTWEGPVYAEMPKEPTIVGSWWYSYTGVTLNGKLHLLTVMSPSGIENGILYDAIFDGSTWNIVHVYGQVDSVGVDSLGNPVYDLNILKQARTPSAAVDNMGRLYAMFWRYEEIGTDTIGPDPYFMVSEDEGLTWTGPAPIFPYADTLDEGRSEFAPTVVDDGNNINIYFFGGIDNYGYNPLYEYTTVTVLPGISESRPDVLKFNVFPTIAKGNVTIQLSLPKATDVNVSLYNVAGQKVKTVYTGTLNAGTHNIPTSTSNLKSGVYFLKINAGERSASRPIIVE